MQRGKIKHRKYAAQIRDFSGLKWGTVTPTDLDGLIEWKDKCYVLMEVKYKTAALPRGQELALERTARDLAKIKPTILLVSSHSTDGDIDMANTQLEKYYYCGQWHQAKPVPLREAVLWFIRKHG